MRTYSILAANIETFTARVAKIARKAAKLGLAEPVVTIGPVYMAPANEGRKLAQADVTIEAGEVVRVEGWAFRALLTHEKEGNVIRSISGEVDSKWRTASSACEHCSTRRARKDTAILLHIDGHTMQVGSSCLVDFLGHSVTNAIAQAEYLHEISNVEEGSSTCCSAYIETAEFVAMVAAAVRVEGWTSAAMVREGHAVSSTADLVLIDHKRFYSDAVTDADRDFAAAALAWAVALQPSNDFEHNLCTLAQGEAFNIRTARMVASIVPAFQRATGAAKTAAKACQGAASQHVGAVGDKLTLTVTVERVITCESSYGVSLLHVMSDEAGNVFTWFASGATKFEANQTVTLKGTVKAHNERNAVAQTVLTRCKVVA